MSALTITTDVVSYRKQVERLAKVTGVGLRDVMRESVSIMAGQLVKRFPPKSLAQGRKAIKNDLNRIVISEKDVMMTGQIDNDRNMIVFNSGAMLAVENRFTNGSISSIHEEARTTNRKRVPKRAGRSYYKKGLKHIDKYIVSESELNGEIKRASARVGDLKSHWSKAAMMFKGAAKMPSWVTRHGAKGIVNDRMKSNGDGYIEITNPLKYASNWTDINNFVVKSQSRMIQKRIAAELKKQAAKFNRSVA